MALDPAALQTSFELVLERNPKLTARFYDILFERYPQVKPLFRRNARAQQEAMLGQALVAVISHLEDEPWLRQSLAAQGQRHVSYGVTRVMYDWVGESLIGAVAETAGPDWTPALESQWTEAYGAIVSMMCPAE